MQLSLSPYFRLLRLHQLAGVYMVFWPCWWSLALASHGNPSARILILFAIGALVMRGAGCIVNDMADRDYDRHVERTRTRPLASGELSMRQAGGLLLVLLMIALAIACALGIKVVLWSALSLVFVAAYPFMKRITWWPQAFLGLTFNWGALMGWVAVKGDVEWPAALLYMGGIFWTLGYDTIYAHQDKDDDIRIGVKSTALYLGQRSRIWIAVFYLTAFLFWVFTGVTAGAGQAYYAGLALVLLHFIWQVYRLDIKNSAVCMKLFRSNAVLGLIFFLGCYV